MPITPIEALKQKLREQFPDAHSSRPAAESYTLPGVPPLPKATISEIVVRPSVSGAALLISDLLEEETHLPLALIDPADCFDPSSYHPRRPLLWLRSRNPELSMKAADILLRDGNLPLVILDASLIDAQSLGRIPSSSWYRLRSLSEQSGTALLALTPTPLIAAAPVRYQLESMLSLSALHELRDSLLGKLSTISLKTKTASLSS